MKPKNTTEGSSHVRQEPVESENPRPKVSRSPSPEQIRQRAYELHLEGGCVHGRDLEDWLQAERELMEKDQ